MSRRGRRSHALGSRVMSVVGVLEAADLVAEAGLGVAQPVRQASSPFGAPARGEEQRGSPSDGGADDDEPNGWQSARGSARPAFEAHDAQDVVEVQSLERLDQLANADRRTQR